jgi:hypothetical protein
MGAALRWGGSNGREGIRKGQEKRRRGNEKEKTDRNMFRNWAVELWST